MDTREVKPEAGKLPPRSQAPNISKRPWEPGNEVFDYSLL